MKLLERMGVQSANETGSQRFLDSIGSSLRSSPNKRYVKFPIEEDEDEIR